MLTLTHARTRSLSLSFLITSDQVHGKDCFRQIVKMSEARSWMKYNAHHKEAADKGYKREACDGTRHGGTVLNFI